MSRLRFAEVLCRCALPVGALFGVASFAAAPSRAYPPSCFANGLPLGQAASDPHAQSLPLTLHGDYNACFVNPAAPSYALAQQECQYSETVAISVFRVPCSGGTSAALFEIDRPTNMQGNTDLFPTFPGVWVQQGLNVAYIRLAQDANTVASQVFVNSPVYNNSIYTLENSSNAAAFDYNQGFTLTADNNNGYAAQFELDSYHVADYASAAQGMPISGYLTGSWYDSAHSGEGMLVQIFDNSDGATLTLSAMWFTYDALGAPYWIAAQGNIAIGATSADNVAVQYLGNGGLAGDFSAATRSAWGTMSFAFADCNHLHFSYASASGLTSPIPTGTGSRDWVRLGSLSNLGCQ